MPTKTKIDEILEEIVTDSEIDCDITLEYLYNDCYGERLMKRKPRRWAADYMEILKKRRVTWKTRKKVDPSGGDQVRIWTEDLKGTPLANDCDFVVWAMPDDTLGRDFKKFLSDAKRWK